MPERANPSLSDILNTFRKSMVKTAGEGEMADPAAVDPYLADPAQQYAEEPHPEDCDCPECVPSADVDDLAQAAQNLDEARAQADMAEEQVVDAAGALQAIADDFIEERTETISKEAQLFGQLFAASCMEQMNKTAQLKEREARAYELASNAIAESGMNKVAAQQLNAVYDQAWRVSMAKLAGFDSAEEMEELADRELTPEEILAIVEAAQDEAQAAEDAEYAEAVGDAEDADDEEAAELASLIAEDQEAGEGDLSDEEVQALAAQLAQSEEDEEDEEVDPEAVAAAANLLAEARDGELDEELGKAASVAYNQTIDTIQNGQFQKTAEQAYNQVSNSIWNERLVKTAEEAYAVTAQALGYQI